MLRIFSPIRSSKQALVLISFMAIITIIDSQAINLFYGSMFGTPSSLHLLLFTILTIIASVINIKLLLYARRNDIHATASRPLLFKVAYVGTSTIQYAISSMLCIMISEMVFFHEYNKIFSLLVLYLSHLWSAILLGIIAITLVHWFRAVRSFSILIYGIAFTVIVFLIMITIVILSEQFTNQSQLIYPRSYTILIENVLIPSRDIAFIYSLGNYVLPLMIISSWILAVSLLKPYADRIGKKTFWITVSLPLLYQVFSFIVRDTNLVSDPGLVGLVYSRQFQFLFGISYQVSGLFFAIAFLIIGRRIKRKIMKNYLIISSLGIFSLFSSMQPGLPFYAAYPPFGLVTVLFLGVSSYLLLVGMLGCAAYVSRDRELRKEIYKGLEKDSEIFNKMGTAEMQREMEKRILPVVHKVKLSEEMIDRMNPDEEDVKLMINEVLNEIRSGASNRKPHNSHV
jgi:hypothetical protein